MTPSLLAFIVVVYALWSTSFDLAVMHATFVLH